MGPSWHARKWRFREAEGLAHSTQLGWHSVAGVRAGASPGLAVSGAACRVHELSEGGDITRSLTKSALSVGRSEALEVSRKPRSCPPGADILCPWRRRK